MPGLFNVVLLMACNALAFSAIPLLMFTGSLVGADLSSDASLATLPIGIMVVGTAIGIVPVSLVMKRLGRKWAFSVFFLWGVGSCVLASISVELRSFSLFCASTAGLGVCATAIQQLRFAAMESVPRNKGPMATSIVLGGGIIGAFLGPELAFRGQHLTHVGYQGSFWLAGLCLLAAGLLILAIKPTEQFEEGEHNSVRPIKAILSDSGFCLAIASAGIGYAVMTFIMTATPISMHHHFHHSLADTKWVIQSHIAAMFLPSFISPLIFRWVGIYGMMKAGLGAYFLSLIIGISSTSVMGFWFQLVFLGIGWNFLFLAGTALLPQTYRKGEQFKAQAFNDGIVFSIQAVASLSSGWVLIHAGWESMLLISVVPMLLLIAGIYWHRKSSYADAGLEKLHKPL